MIARLLICSSKEIIVGVIKEELKKNSLNQNHPDVLYFHTGRKLGITEARKIKEHFSLKPYSAKGRAVILENASILTTEAQNALLKTIEELPREAILILGATSDANLLPTILSRCEITNLETTNLLETKDNEAQKNHKKDISEIELLLNASMEERFGYVEKLKELKDKEEFLRILVWYFHQNILDYPEFTAQLLQAEGWAKQNVNIRAILEYLMLVMPKLESSHKSQESGE